MVIHTAKAVPVEYIEGVESEEEVEPLRKQRDSLGSLQVLFLVSEVAYVPQRFRSVSKRIVRSLGERGSVDLGSRSKFIIPELPKEGAGIRSLDYVRPCVASRRLARKGTSCPIVLLHEEREAGRVGIHTA